jgi:hypothetical protein
MSEESQNYDTTSVEVIERGIFTAKSKDQQPGTGNYTLTVKFRSDFLQSPEVTVSFSRIKQNGSGKEYTVLMGVIHNSSNTEFVVTIGTDDTHNYLQIEEFDGTWEARGLVSIPPPRDPIAKKL